jgi:putative aldouronate transport system permease protein
MLINNLGLINNRLALIIPYGVNTWNIIIMRTHYKSIPKSLTEAAYIDGANDFWILMRVFIPLSGAVSAVLVLFSGVNYWNMWFEPMIYLNERAKYPLQSMLREILIDSQQVMVGSGTKPIRQEVSRNQFFETQVKYANIVISTVPILVLYPFLQKYFVKGVMLGSLKE